MVEFFPTTDSNKSEEIFSGNLNAYLEIIKWTANASYESSIDIIVFPEGTLNRAGPYTVVPDPNDNYNPCLDNFTELYEDFLVELSCAARNVRKYLVINLSEKELNLNHGANLSKGLNEWNIYNTNVVFDRDGKVISRYRKYHLYINEGNTTAEPEFGIFNTDFGVTFGHFICYDILFYTPAQELVEKYNLTDIIFTNKFVSELPFLTGKYLSTHYF